MPNDKLVIREYLKCTYCGDSRDAGLHRIFALGVKLPIICSNCDANELAKIMENLGFEIEGWHKRKNGKLHYFNSNENSLCGNSHWDEEYYDAPVLLEQPPDNSYCVKCINIL